MLALPGSQPENGNTAMTAQRSQNRPAVEMINHDLDNPALDPELRRLDDFFIRSYYGKDIDGLNSFFSADFTYVDGLTGREVARPDYDKACLAAAPFRNLVHDQVHIKISGDTAMVAARNRCERQIEGKWTPVEVRYADCYRRIDGKWRCIYATVYKVAR
jgi:ketosteroid isomerase-like protein